jgi:hypothetical protein
VEVSSRASIEEWNESTVLVRQETDRLDLTTSNMTKNLLSNSVRGNITQVDSSASSCNDTRAHWNRRGGRQRCLHAVATSGGLGRVELRRTIGRWRDYSSIWLRWDGLLYRAWDPILLVVISLLLLKPRKALELRAGKSSWGARLKRTA